MYAQQVCVCIYVLVRVCLRLFVCMYVPSLRTTFIVSVIQQVCFCLFVCEQMFMHVCMAGVCVYVGMCLCLRMDACMYVPPLQPHA